MTICSIALIGFGEVGQVLAHDLQRVQGAQLAAWDRLFAVEGSEPQRAARALAFVRPASGMADAIAGGTVVISAVTAAECLAAASEAAPSLTGGAFYLDLNSVSPRTKTAAARTIEAAGGRYVEAAVMSPIAPKRMAAPVWLGGPHAREFLPLAHTLGFAGSTVYSATIGEASAAKMCRSVIVKGVEALLAESLLTARRHGVEDDVLASLQDLFPVEDWRKLARYMIARSLRHGCRRAEEMREAARTVADAGFEPWMSRGIIERQRWAGEHADALHQIALTDLLDQLLAQTPAEAPAPGAAPASAAAVGRVKAAARL
jgi:3-hydroxyisobutyrate dehydrogenase-like beta-hydroxyacid dehydrogenase